MKVVSPEKAMNLMQPLIGLPLKYISILEKWDLFVVGIGEAVSAPDPNSTNGGMRTLSPYAIHSFCGFDIVYRDESRRVDHIDLNITNPELYKMVTPLKNHCIKRIVIRKNNVLRLDFGLFWIVFTPFDDEEESWRYFVPGSPGEAPHLVASCTRLTLGS